MHVHVFLIFQSQAQSKKWVGAATIKMGLSLIKEKYQSNEIDLDRMDLV